MTGTKRLNEKAIIAISRFDSSFNSMIANYEQNILKKVSKDTKVELIENFDSRMEIQNLNLI